MVCLASTSVRRMKPKRGLARLDPPVLQSNPVVLLFLTKPTCFQTKSTLGGYFTTWYTPCMMVKELELKCAFSKAQMSALRIPQIAIVHGISVAGKVT